MKPNNKKNKKIRAAKKIENTKKKEIDILNRNQRLKKVIKKESGKKIKTKKGKNTKRKKEKNGRT